MSEDHPPVLAGAPLPSPGPGSPETPFWEAARQGRLVVLRCDGCGRHHFPSVDRCRRCRSTALTWVEVPAAGTLFTWSRVWHPVHPGMAGDVPFVLAVVEVVPGEVRMLGDLVDPPDGDLPIGARVEAVFEHHDEVTLVQWRLAGA